MKGECCFHKSKMVVQLLSFYFQRLCQQYSQCVVFRQRFIFLSFPWKKVWKKELFLLYRKFYFGFKSFFFFEFFCISVWWASGCLLTDCCHLVWSKTVKLQMCPRTWENMGIVLQKAAVGLEAIWYQMYFWVLFAFYVFIFIHHKLCIRGNDSREANNSFILLWWNTKALQKWSSVKL